MNLYWNLVLAVLLLICCSSFGADLSEWVKPGKCKHLWRQAKLLGRCFGLDPYREFAPELKGLNVSTAEECRALCCNLGDRCISWQFFYKPNDHSVRECKLTKKILRLGTESTGTPEWCDPHPPSRWNGNRLVAKNVDGTCTWGESLPGQCFGLGVERLDSNNKALDTNACREACCKDKECQMWQEVPGRGCYFSKSDGIWCETDIGLYEGARKCIPNFCDGKESEILTKQVV